MPPNTLIRLETPKEGSPRHVGDYGRRANGACGSCRNRLQARNLMIMVLRHSVIFEVFRACCAIMPA
jgi:hypothetical protein